MQWKPSINPCLDQGDWAEDRCCKLIMLSQFRYHSIILLVCVCDWLDCVAGWRPPVSPVCHMIWLTQHRFKPSDTPLTPAAETLRGQAASVWLSDSVGLTHAPIWPAVSVHSTGAGCLTTRALSNEQPRFCACVAPSPRRPVRPSTSFCKIM